MKIGYNLLAPADEMSGDTLASIVSQDREDDHIAFIVNKRKNIEGREFSVSYLGLERNSAGWIKEEAELPLALIDKGIDVYFSPTFRLPRRQPCRTIATVDSSTVFTEKDETPPWIEERLRSFSDVSALKKANRIIARSSSSKSRIEQLGISGNRISVILPPSSGSFRPVFDNAKLEKARQRFGIKEHFYIYAGGSFKRNSLTELLETFKAFHKLAPSSSLVITGAVGNKQKKDLSRRLPEALVLTGPLADEDLCLLYNGATAFITASEFEDFPFNAFDAVSCGIPVICPDEPCFSSPLKNCAVLVKRGDRNAFVRAMKDARDNQNMRLKFRALGTQLAKSMTAERTAKELLSVIKEVSEETYRPDGK